MREASQNATTTQTGNLPLTKPEAVRRAIAALGYKAEVSEILAYCREHFGIGTDTGRGLTPDVGPVAEPAPIQVKGSPSPKSAPAKRNNTRERSGPAE